MVVYPNAKINIGLSVVAKREDGFHDIETLLYPLPGLHDVLEIHRSGGAKGVCELVNTGLYIDCEQESNLVVRAYKLLAAPFDLPGVKVTLKKIIPYAAGLGGGSSDAAFMLKGLNEFFDLKIPERNIYNYATRLGSDCAFFIRNTPAIVSGRGEKLEEFNLPTLKDYKVVVLKPSCAVSTKEAYADITPQPADFDLHMLKQLPVERWMLKVRNDFEMTIFRKHPEIEKLKNWLYAHGASYASMTGSGSGVYGIFPRHIKVKPEALQLEFFWREDDDEEN